MQLKHFVLGLWLCLLCGIICMIFWSKQVKYLLPTPVPAGYAVVPTGTAISNAYTASGKPSFIHFFNPACPCSRFNMPHVKSLIRKYGDRANFSIVVVSDDSTLSAQKIQKEYNLDVPVSFDRTLADRCGVYSTPQAVILTADQKLFYRGNYNKSRYCTDAKTNYAQNALDSLLADKNINADNNATTAYGCQLSSCTNLIK